MKNYFHTSKNKTRRNNMNFKSAKESFKKASTVGKIGIGLGVAAGAVFIPHVVLVAAAGGVGYAGYQGYKLATKNNGPKQ
jgi:hypothetical protein